MLREPTAAEPAGDPPVVGREIRPRHVHPQLCDRAVIGLRPRVTARLEHGVGDALEEPVATGPVVVQPWRRRRLGSPSRPSSAASIFDPPASTARSAGSLGSASSGRSSSRTNRAPRAPSTRRIVGRRVRVCDGHVWSRTTAPSPCRRVPSIASRTIAAFERDGSQSSSSTSQCTSRYPSPWRIPCTRGRRAVAERAPEPRSGRLTGGVDDRGLRVLHVRPDPLVGEQGHARMVVRVVADQMSVVGDPAHVARPAPGALHEERRDVVRGERREDPIDVADPRPGRSGCSASNVSATRSGPHSRVVTFEARTNVPGCRPCASASRWARAGSGRSRRPARAAIEGADPDVGTARPERRVDRRRRDLQHRGARSRGASSRAGDPTLGLGSVASTTRPAAARPARAGRDGTARRRRPRPAGRPPPSR